MVEGGTRVSDPAAHQPTKAEMEEDVKASTPRQRRWRGQSHVAALRDGRGKQLRDRTPHWINWRHACQHYNIP